MKHAALASVVLAVVGLVSWAQAADEKASPVGTWKWEQTFGGNTREVVLKLKVDGEKLTGTISGRDNTETDISDGKFKDNEVSFNVVREIQGTKRTQKYKGKLDKDTIKGKVNRETQNGDMESDWEAKREKK